MIIIKVLSSVQFIRKTNRPVLNNFGKDLLVEKPLSENSTFYSHFFAQNWPKSKFKGSKAGKF